MSKLVIFDLETTGKEVDSAQIVQLAAMKFNSIIDEDCEESMVILLKPTCPIGKESAEVHGFTEECVADCPGFADVAEEVLEFIGDCDLGGHNMIAFDLPVLIAEFKRHTSLRFEIGDRRLIDSLHIFRHIMPHTLEAALTFFTGEKLIGAHDAECDTKATAAVISAELKEYDLTLDKAHEISMGNRLTLDGKILNSEEGPVIAFGKFAGRTLDSLSRTDRGFLRWILKRDFTKETQNYALRALNGDFRSQKPIK